MSRQRYLIAYDIANPQRLRRVIKIMESYGDRLQYSVFLCDLSVAEFRAWQAQILDTVKTTDDSVVTIPLGPPGATKINVIGASRRLPTQGPVIV